MRTLANLALLACAFTFSTTCFAQSSDPFAQSSDPFGGDPFAADPFQNKRAKPATEKAPATRTGHTPTKRTPNLDPNKLADKAADATLRIRSALDNETSQTFVEIPLQDAIQQLSQIHKIPIVIDRRALEEIGLAADEPVNLSLQNVTLRSFLRLMLRDLDLTYMVKDEVMQITTVEAAEQNLTVEMYRYPKELVDKSDKVISALTGAVVPDTWESLGGPSSVSAIENVLVVSTTQDVHDRVSDFLDKLEKALDAREAKK